MAYEKWILGAGAKKNCKLFMVLDKPNNKNARYKTHLEGVELQFMKRVLAHLDISWEEVYITFAIKEYFPKLEPRLLHFSSHGDALRQEIKKIDPEKILIMGPIGYAMLMLSADRTGDNIPKITSIRGRLEYYLTDEGKEYLVQTTIPHFYCFGDHPEWFRDFTHDLYRMAVNDAPDVGAFPQNDIIICATSTQLRRELKKLSNAKIVSCDIETGGLDFKVHNIETIGFAALRADYRGAKCVIIPHTLLHTLNADEYFKTQELVRNFVQGKTFKHTLVLHNAKFDLKFIAEWLNEPIQNKKIRDTLLLNYLLDERGINMRSSPHGLKNLSRVKYDADHMAFDWDEFWEKEMHERNWEPLFKYLGYDLYYTLRLYYDLRKEFKEEMPSAQILWENIICPSMIALAEVERQGVPIDLAHYQQAKRELEQEMHFLIEGIEQLVEDTGGPIGAFNPNSSMQVRELLYDHFGLPDYGQRTKGGKKKTDAKHLNDIMYRTAKGDQSKELINGRKFIELLLQYRKIKKTLSTYIKPFLVKSKQGKLYGIFNLAGTGTGRLSSEKPNLQNIPQMAGPLVRKGFIAPPGHAWLKVDFSQLELRVAAHLSHDKKMLQAFRDGRDIHAEVAAAMFLIDPNDVSKKQRYAAKFVDFGILYGRGASSLAYGPELREYNWSRNDAQQFIDNYLDEFHELREWMHEQKWKAVKEQHSTTELGRMRRWPFVLPDSVHLIERQALNFPIQSLASDITLNALQIIHFWLLREKKESSIVLTVHDEIDLIVPWYELHEVAHQVKYLMETSSPVELSVPLRADVELGPNWGTLEDYEVDIYPEWLGTLI